MACQQAKFTDASDLADFIYQLVQNGCAFDIVQTESTSCDGKPIWIVDLS